MTRWGSSPDRFKRALKVGYVRHRFWWGLPNPSFVRVGQFEEPWSHKASRDRTAPVSLRLFFTKGGPHQWVLVLAVVSVCLTLRSDANSTCTKACDFEQRTRVFLE